MTPYINNLSIEPITINGDMFSFVVDVYVDIGEPNYNVKWSDVDHNGWSDIDIARIVFDFSEDNEIFKSESDLTPSAWEAIIAAVDEAVLAYIKKESEESSD